MEEAEKDKVSLDLIKSKKRVADYGEVFTPPWLVESMLELTEESDRIDARFLEPAFGTGNFLIQILKRKLAIVELTTKKAGQERRRLALKAVMSIYGIELLKDNILECRKRLLIIFANFLEIGRTDEFYQAASRVLSLNLIHGDTLKMRTIRNQPIIFAEWNYSGKGRFLRRDFLFQLLIQTSGDKRNELEPTYVHDPMTVSEIAYSSKSQATRKML